MNYWVNHVLYTNGVIQSFNIRTYNHPKVFMLHHSVLPISLWLQTAPSILSNARCHGVFITFRLSSSLGGGNVLFLYWLVLDHKRQGYLHVMDITIDFICLYWWMFSLVSLQLVAWNQLVISLSLLSPFDARFHSYCAVYLKFKLALKKLSCRIRYTQIFRKYIGLVS